MVRKRNIIASVVAFAATFAIYFFGSHAIAWAQSDGGEAAAPSEAAAAPAVGESETGSADVDQPARPWPEVPPVAGDTSPGDTQADLARGEVLLKLGHYEDAAHAFGRVLVHDPLNVRARERLRRCAVAAGRTDLVPGLTVDLVRVYIKVGKPDLAGERLDELIAVDPQHPNRTELEAALGRTGTARTDDTSLLDRARSFLGIFVLLGIALALSNNRKKISLRIVLWGIGMQLVFGLFILRTDAGHMIFDGARVVINRILSYTDEGAGFLFGNMYNGLAAGPASGPVMYTDGTSGDLRSLGMIFAFHVLPTIIFFGALMSVLYHLGVIQKLVKGIAWAMQRVMGTSGVESLSAAGNIFVGQTEAPLLIKPYLPRMTMSELTAVMCGGFATVAGGVLAAYVRFGIDAGHLLAASVMSAPAALVVAKIIYPETETPQTLSGATDDIEKETTNVIDAAASGATDGLKLALNVAAMLIAFIALVAMVNGLLGAVGGWFGADLSLRSIFGLAFYPLSWCMGVDSGDLIEFGNLLGTKIAINEFVAYVDLGAVRNTMSPRSFTIATYALCGFANFSSIGIQIGGISAIAPGRRADLARIGLKAMIGGAIASWLTACVAGMMI